MRRTTALAILPVAAVALLAGACSSDDKAADTTTTSTTSTKASTTSSTAAGSTSTTKAGTPACSSGELAGELGPSNAGAGQVYNPLVVRNTGTTTCEVHGFPGVSLLDGSGNQIGEPATREGNEGAAVVLKPGESASATLHTTNEGVGPTCSAPAAQIKVFPPNQTQALTFPATYTACGGFSVTTMVAGANGTS
jgi:hypothetical protein